MSEDPTCTCRFLDGTGPHGSYCLSEPAFEAFPSIPRLKRTCTITEKIDGSNAQVYIGTDGQIRFGSRNRWVTPEDDNFGFARWGEEHREELLKLGPGRHFGEWWGSGIQRTYGLKEKRFSLFNTARWTPESLPPCVGLVPVLYEGDFSTQVVDEVMAKLRAEGSLATPGFMDPEGVVVYLPQARSLFKVTFDDRHKGETKIQKSPDASRKEAEQRAKELVTPAQMNLAMESIVAEYSTGSVCYVLTEQDTGRVIKLVQTGLPADLDKLTRSAAGRRAAELFREYLNSEGT